MEIEPDGSFLKTCVALSGLFVELGNLGRFLNPDVVISFLHSLFIQYFLTFQMNRGKLSVSILFSKRVKKTHKVLQTGCFRENKYFVCFLRTEHFKNL